MTWVGHDAQADRQRGDFRWLAAATIKEMTLC
jgi:hypothetical protein